VTAPGTLAHQDREGHASLEGTASVIAAVFGFSVLASIDGWTTLPSALWELLHASSLAGAMSIVALRRQHLWHLPVAVTILVGYAALTLASTLVVTGDPMPLIWQELVRAVMVGFTAYLLGSSLRQLNALTWGAVIGVAVVAIGAQGGHLGLDAVDPDNGRLAGPVGEPNFFAQFQAVGLTFGARLAIARLGPAGRVVAAGCAVLALQAIVTSESRGALVALAFTVMLVVSRRRGSRVRQAAVVLAIVGAVVLNTPAGDRLVRAPSAVSSTLATGQAEDGAVAGRLSENIAAVKMFVDHPVFGVGYSQYPDRYLEYSVEIQIDDRNEERESHNLHLEVLAETGIIGGLFWLAVIVWVLGATSRARRDASSRMGVLADAWHLAFVNWLLTSIFLHDSFPELQWFLVGGALAAAEVASHERRRAAQDPMAAAAADELSR
jgi:O-antigen ligase